MDHPPGTEQYWLELTWDNLGPDTLEKKVLEVN